VRSITTSVLLALLLSLPTLSACGSDEGDRGLTPSDEVSTPESASENRMSEAQREQANEQEEQDLEIQEFDAAEGGNP
jgi:hypothetical protein